MIPNEKSFCEIDPDGEGSLGNSRPAVPLGVERLRARSGPAHAVHVPRDSRRHGRPGQRRRQRLDLRASLRRHSPSLSRPRSTRPRHKPRRPTPISRGGAIIHEVGTIRMGNDPQTSVLNRFCQAHDVKNLFVADAAPFVGNPDKNPDPHDRRAGVAHRRVPRRRNEEGRMSDMSRARRAPADCAGVAAAGMVDRVSAQEVHHLRLAGDDCVRRLVRADRFLRARIPHARAADRSHHSGRERRAWCAGGRRARRGSTCWPA